MSHSDVIRLADLAADAGVGADVAKCNFSQFASESLFLVDAECARVNGKGASEVIVDEGTGDRGGVVAGIGRVGVRW